MAAPSTGYKEGQLDITMQQRRPSPSLCRNVELRPLVAQGGSSSSTFWRGNSPGYAPLSVDELQQDPEESVGIPRQKIPRRHSKEDILRNFTIMSILFSANHGCVVACLALATARLGSVVGGWQSGILYLTYTLSALLGATYIVKSFGARNSLILGMGLYISYVGCFVVAMHQVDEPHSQRLTAYTGAALGGIGAGFLWTAQGAYFSQSAEEHASIQEEEDRSSTSSTSLLAGIFAFWYLAEEVALRLVSTLLLEAELASWEGVFGLYSAITILSTASMLCVHDFPVESEPRIISTSGNAAKNPDTASSSMAASHQAHSIWHKATAALQLLLWDPKMKYMIGLNAAYGFASAFCNSYVNGEVAPVALDDPNSKWLGLLTSWGSAVAAMMSLIFGRGTQDKGHVLIAGAVCFGLVGGLFVVVPAADDWGWPGLLLVYTFMGVGRATFEGTLKATFADYFAYEKEGAFANIILQNGLSGSIGYILTFSSPCQELSRYCVLYRDGSHQYILPFELTVIVSSIAGVLGYLRASALWQHEVLQKQHEVVEMPSSSASTEVA